MKKTCSKKGLAMLLSAALLGSLAACGTAPSQGSTSTGNSTPPASVGGGEVAKVVVWSNNRHDADYTQGKIAEFNKTNEGRIEIEYIIQTDNYANMITMAASSKQAPDIFSISGATGGYDLRSFVDAGIIQPLTAFIDSDAEFRKFVNIDEYMVEGTNAIGEEIYWIPRTVRSGNRLIYNQELFEKAGIKEMPKTLDEMVAVAQKITDLGEGVQYGCTIPGQSAAITRMIIPVAEISGIYYYNYKEGTFDFSGYKPVLEGFKKMFADGTMLPGCASMKVDPTRVQFSEGNVGFYGNASQEVGVLTTQFPAKMEWGAIEIPSLTGEIKGSLTATPFDGLCLSKDSANPDAAYEVIKWFSSIDFMKGYVEAGLATSTSKDIMAAADLSGIGKMADFAPLPYESVYLSPPAVTPQGKDWQDALWETVIPGGTDIDSTIAEMNKIYNEALDRDIEMGKVQRLVIADFDPMNPLAGTATYLDK